MKGKTMIVKNLKLDVIATFNKHEQEWFTLMFLDKDTLKPYRGKQMNRYAMYSKDGAENYLEKIKNKFGSL